MTGSACGCGERAPESATDSREAVPQTATNGDGTPLESPGADLRGFPADIPIPDGLRTTAVNSLEPGSLTALFTGDMEPEDVAKVFEDGLRKQGWSIDESRRRGDDLGLFARKEQRIASVIVTRISGKLHVELGVWSPKAE